MSEHGTPIFTIVKEHNEWIVRDQDGQKYGPPSTTKEAAQELMEDWERYYNAS